MKDKELEDFIVRCIAEDIGDGDHTSLACIPEEAVGKAYLLVKEEGVIAGVKVAEAVFNTIDQQMSCEVLINDGEYVTPGDIVFYVTGKQQSILKAERLVLNIMQRMSGIATNTRKYVDEVSGFKAHILDTRKTTPGMRFLEKQAVAIGGAQNHRMGLFDMIMLKDNHIDFAGGIPQAIAKVKRYLAENNRDLRIEVEARTLDDVRQILEVGGIDRIMLDNFAIHDTKVAVDMIAGLFETEASGGITLSNLRKVAETGVDFISIGELTHHIQSIDLSLKVSK